jgi:hypothetical protein
LGWSAKRELAKINYHIHTDAIKQNLIPQKLTVQQIVFVYASEADILNMALFGFTAQQWKNENPTLKGNQRDYATINQLICLLNLENVWDELKTIYNGDFKNLVYGKLPNEEDILATLKMILESILLLEKLKNKSQTT